MIASTYALSGVLLACTAYLFSRNLLSAQQLTIAWMIVFFFASAAASSAYLTVSEIFSARIARARHRVLLRHRHRNRWHRGTAAVWHADRYRLARERRYRLLALARLMMIGAAAVEAFWGVAAERKPLETVSRPLAFDRLKNGERTCKARTGNFAIATMDDNGYCRSAPARFRPAPLRDPARYRRHHPRYRAVAAAGLGAGGPARTLTRLRRV